MTKATGYKTKVNSSTPSDTLSVETKTVTPEQQLLLALAEDSAQATALKFKPLLLVQREQQYFWMFLSFGETIQNETNSAARWDSQIGRLFIDDWENMNSTVANEASLLMMKGL